MTRLMFGYGGRNEFHNWFVAIGIQVVTWGNLMCGHVVGVEEMAGC